MNGINTQRTRSRTKASGPFSLAARVLLLSAIVVLPWFWGGVRDLPIAVFGLSIGLCAALTAVALLRKELKTFSPPWVALLLLGSWITWQVLQCSPLILEYITPATQLNTRYGACFAPDASFDKLLLSGCYLTLFWLTTCLFAHPDWLRRLLWVLLIAGTAQALFGSLMVLSKQEWLLFEVKRWHIGSATGTFANRNHYADYLCMALASGFALLITQRPADQAHNLAEKISNWLSALTSPKMLTRVLSAVIVVGLIMSRSRMGNMACFSALTITFLLYFILVKEDRRLSLIMLFMSMLLIDMAILSQWFGLEQLADRLQQTHTATESRFQVINDFVAMAKIYWPEGIGLGALSSVYPMHRTSTTWGFYDYVHNDYLQFLIEAGVGSIFLALFVIYALLKALTILHKAKRPVARAGAAAALMTNIAIMIHISVEFSLQIPGVAASFMVLLALPWASQNISAHSSGTRKSRR